MSCVASIRLSFTFCVFSRLIFASSMETAIFVSKSAAFLVVARTVLVTSSTFCPTIVAVDDNSWEIEAFSFEVSLASVINSFMTTITLNRF